MNLLPCFRLWTLAGITVAGLEHENKATDRQNNPAVIKRAEITFTWLSIFTDGIKFFIFIIFKC
jgi:hypothetical protein